MITSEQYIKSQLAWQHGVMLTTTVAINACCLIAWALGNRVRSVGHLAGCDRPDSIFSAVNLDEQPGSQPMWVTAPSRWRCSHASRSMS